ncbi:MAG: class I SAM-dependent methyltransferase [Proteobacteria bacterium]|nr:class I SAM-dependent methyltransferase [Burkholderiales bacterium]
MNEVTVYPGSDSAAGSITDQEIVRRARSAMPAAGQLFMRVLDRIRVGRIDLVTPEGVRLWFGGDPGPHATLTLRSWAAAEEILRTADIGLAEAYMAGDCDIDRPTDLLTIALLNQQHIERAFYGNWFAVLWYRLRHLSRANTRSGSRRNIVAHYDLGNEFYQLWLDPTMSYSSAYFGGDFSRSLAQAQQAKYERILDRLGAGPGDRILEIGCGWGGFAEAAARRGCRLTGITISPAQLEYARARIERAGLTDRVDLSLTDYRDLDGRFDHVVSIEMYEAVGERFWPGFFRAVHHALKPGGKALIQGITIHDEVFGRYRRGTDFIQQHVFPGGMLASESEFARQSASAGLVVESTEAFGCDYAETLRRWLKSFTEGEPRVRALGFDDRFIRLWRFYLAYCAAGFDSGRTDVMHFEMTRARAGDSR